jgi:hypothetical protein
MVDLADREAQSLRDISRTADRLARRMGAEFVPDQKRSVEAKGEQSHDALPMRF